MKAVIFDLGGVVLESPMGVIAEFERVTGLAPGSVNKAVADRGRDGAWAQLERGEIDRVVFSDRVAAELGSVSAAGVSGMLAVLDREMGVRQPVVDRIRALRKDGFRVAALTNNWARFPATGLREEFDVFVESVLEGHRKPEPEIYRICVERLGVKPPDCVMLDDIGANLRTARELGMATVLVRDPLQMLEDLSSALDATGSVER